MPPASSFFSHTKHVCRSVIVPSPLSTKRGAPPNPVHGPQVPLTQINVSAKSVPASQVVPSGLPAHGLLGVSVGVCVGVVDVGVYVGGAVGVSVGVLVSVAVAVSVGVGVGGATQPPRTART